MQVHLQSYHRFVLHGFGLFLLKSVFCSKVYATLKMVSSSKGLANICKPIGRFEFVNPQLSDIAGRPARFAGIVKMSERYMLKGSRIFSPILKAGVGEVGVIMQSQALNALSKSSFIFVLTFWAFR